MNYIINAVSLWNFQKINFGGFACSQRRLGKIALRHSRKTVDRHSPRIKRARLLESFFTNSEWHSTAPSSDD